MRCSPPPAALLTRGRRFDSRYSTSGSGPCSISRSYPIETREPRGTPFALPPLTPWLQLYMYGLRLYLLIDRHVSVKCQTLRSTALTMTQPPSSCRAAPGTHAPTCATEILQAKSSYVTYGCRPNYVIIAVPVIRRRRVRCGEKNPTLLTL